MNVTFSPPWDWHNQVLDEMDEPISDSWWESIERREADYESEAGNE